MRKSLYALVDCAAQPELQALHPDPHSILLLRTLVVRVFPAIPLIIRRPNLCTTRWMLVGFVEIPSSEIVAQVVPPVSTLLLFGGQLSWGRPDGLLKRISGVCRMARS